MNLLKETIEDIKNSGHAPEDIVFIGSSDSGHCCSWDEFTRLANVDYDDGYGAQEVASDLIIVFGDGSSMWRQEYDGSESWAFSRPFSRPEKTKPINRLVVRIEQVGWQTLAEINDPEA